MELLDYIRKNYKTPNIAVLKTLGATDELIKYLVNTPNNTNIKIVESLINEGGSEADNGIKSITISPAITTTPTLESFFPIYWEDLTEEQKQQGVAYLLSASNEPAEGTPVTITITPTGDWYAYDANTGTACEKGQPMPITLNYAHGMLDNAMLMVVNEPPTGGAPEKYVMCKLAFVFS